MPQGSQRPSRQPSPRPARVATYTQHKNDILPRHHQIYVVLRQKILEGYYPADRPMPGEFELSDLFNTSRITLRRALERLEQDGLVVRRRGSGTFATPPQTAMPIRANLRGLFENLQQMGLKTTAHLHEFAYITAPPDIARVMEIKPASILQKAVRVRRYKGTPFSHLTTYIPEDIGRSYQQTDLEAKPLLQLLERAGVRISYADQVITAKLADVMVAPLLQLDIGAPLLCVKRKVRDQSKRMVEYIEALYRPDMYEYEMTLSRKNEKGGVIWSSD